MNNFQALMERTQTPELQYLIYAATGMILWPTARNNNSVTMCGRQKMLCW